MSEVRRRRRNASQWSKLLEQWAKSGESAERFAARVGVKPSTLAKWQKAEASKTTAAAPMVRAKKKERAESLFAHLQVMEPASRAEGSSRS
jgi:transcriptional regulator with XRE-family HTH domain